MMKGTLIGLAVAAAALFAAWVGMTGLLQTHAPGLTPGSLWLQAAIVGKLCMIVVILLIALALVLGVVGLLARPAAGPMAVTLQIVAGVCVLLGGLGAAHGWTMIQTALARVGPVQPAVIAPGQAEALLVLSVGLIGAVVSLALAVVCLMRRGRRGTA